MKILLILGLLYVPITGQARQMVLVQGYLGDAGSWRQAGITAQLERHGWAFRGVFHYQSDGVRLVSPLPSASRAPSSSSGYYQVELPTEAPVAHQAFYLGAYLKYLRDLYPHEVVTVVGHSAGGVVARYAMVRNPELNIDQLITIASPHLGTGSADVGRIVGETPLAILAPLFGAGTLNRSQALYADLLPEMPHRFLYWLNRQPHPAAEYISIVRGRENPDGGDLVVPQRSQHLEHVVALRYQARSYILRGTHALSPADGRLLLDLIHERRVPSLSGW